ncbi:MAG: hypothetical protein ACLU6Y_13330 [Ruminococcus sp.]
MINGKTDTRPPLQHPVELFRRNSGKSRRLVMFLDETALIKNAELMGKIAERTGCKMLLAQKAFSNYDCYHLLEPYLAGTEASGLYEARLGAQEMPGKEVHVFCDGYM